MFLGVSACGNSDRRITMYNRQPSQSAFPCGNNHVCEVQFKLFD